jgi:histidine triad (HIT) family protein
MVDCPLCSTNPRLKDDVLLSNDHCLLIQNRDPVLQSSLMIIPARHVSTPFELTTEEWAAIQELLIEAKRMLDHDGPDGYSIGWNVNPVGGQSVPHVHLHVIGRFADEPLAGQGIRHALKQPHNRRATLPDVRS